MRESREQQGKELNCQVAERLEIRELADDHKLVLWRIGLEVTLGRHMPPRSPDITKDRQVSLKLCAIGAQLLLDHTDVLSTIIRSQVKPLEFQRIS